VNATNLTRLFLLIAVFALAASVRLWIAGSYAAVPIADAADYHRLAVGLANGSGYINEAGAATAWRPPGYPAFLAGLYSLFGASVRAATFAQALLGAATVLLIVALGWILIGWHESVVAGFIAAIYPSLTWLSRLLLSENLALFLIVASLCLAAIVLRSPRVWLAALLGIVLGFSLLVRGANLLFAIVLLAGVIVALARGNTNWKRIATIAFVAIAAITVTMLPWTVRNYRVFGAFVPVATQDGFGLYASYWPPVRNGRIIWGTLPGKEDPNVETASRLTDEVAQSKYFQRVTFQGLRDEPGRFFRLIPSKMISLVVPLDWEILPHPVGSGRKVNWGYILIVLPALAGFILVWRNRRPGQWLLWVIPILVLVQTVLFYGSPRFRLAAEPIAILLASVALVRGWAFLKNRRALLR
jgi:4-amino-4-deoxy-L-arabinose transferase-like glycosyltransferase